LLFIVVFTGVVFFNMVKVFFVPVVLAAVFAGLFHPFYEWLLKLACGRRVGLTRFDGHLGGAALSRKRRCQRNN